MSFSYIKLYYRLLPMGWIYIYIKSFYNFFQDFKNETKIKISIVKGCFYSISYDHSSVDSTTTPAELISRFFFLDDREHHFGNSNFFS